MTTWWSFEWKLTTGSMSGEKSRAVCDELRSLFSEDKELKPEDEFQTVSFASAVSIIQPRRKKSSIQVDRWGYGIDGF